MIVNGFLDALANLTHNAQTTSATARRLAEAGRSNQQIKAVTGHTTDAEVSRYTAAAEQSKLADQAIGMISK